MKVDLSKALLVMFMIDRVYKVEYKGLHLLHLNCVKFSHYMKGCGEKAMQVAKEGDGVQEGEKNVEYNGIQGGSKVQEGPCSVVIN